MLDHNWQMTVWDIKEPTPSWCVMHMWCNNKRPPYKGTIWGFIIVPKRLEIKYLIDLIEAIPFLIEIS
jgi:hypothetical protein